MRALPLPTQCSISDEWAASLDGLSRERHQYHVSEILDKIVELLKRDGKDKDKEAGDLIHMELNTEKKESNMGR